MPRAGGMLSSPKWVVDVLSASESGEERRVKRYVLNV
jgi:hypothetical protein